MTATSLRVRPLAHAQAGGQATRSRRPAEPHDVLAAGIPKAVSPLRALV